MPRRVNPQTRNVGNLGDIIKHAALVELASRLAGLSASVRHVETHTFLLDAPPADVGRWSREVDAFVASHPAYAGYAALERAHMTRTTASGAARYRCSSGLVLDVLGERLRTATLAEADAATRAELREQIAREDRPEVVVADEAVEALRAARDGVHDAVLVHVDPFTLSPELWARLAPSLDALCSAAAEVVVLVYRYIRQAGSPWPAAPRGTVGPVADLHRNPHEVAVYVSPGVAEGARGACAALGWRLLRG